MRKNGRSAHKSSSGAVICWVMLVVIVCIAVKLLTNTGVNEKLEEAVRKHINAEECMNLALDFEFGTSPEKNMIYQILSGGNTESEETKDLQTEESTVQEHSAESAIPEYYTEEASVQEKTEKLD